jgi:hypothetical protein
MATEVERARPPSIGEPALANELDHKSMIGEIADGVFVEAGPSGHGFKLAPALGKLVSGLVMGKQPHPDFSQFHPDRLRAPDPSRRAMVWRRFWDDRPEPPLGEHNAGCRREKLPSYSP